MTASGDRLRELTTDPRPKAGRRLRIQLADAQADPRVVTAAVEAVVDEARRVGVTDWSSMRLTVELDRHPSGDVVQPPGLVVEVRGRVGDWALAGEV